MTDFLDWSRTRKLKIGEAVKELVKRYGFAVTFLRALNQSLTSLSVIMRGRANAVAEYSDALYVHAQAQQLQDFINRLIKECQELLDAQDQMDVLVKLSETRKRCTTQLMNGRVPSLANFHFFNEFRNALVSNRYFPALAVSRLKMKRRNAIESVLETEQNRMIEAMNSGFNKVTAGFAKMGKNNKVKLRNYNRGRGRGRGTYRRSDQGGGRGGRFGNGRYFESKRQRYQKQQQQKYQDVDDESRSEFHAEQKRKIQKKAAERMKEQPPHKGIYVHSVVPKHQRPMLEDRECGWWAKGGCHHMQKPWKCRFFHGCTRCWRCLSHASAACPEKTEMNEGE